MRGGNADHSFCHRFGVPPSPVAPHKNEEWCHHNQRIQRKATAQPACLTIFKDDLQCWVQPVCFLCFGFAAWLSEQELNPASLSCLHSPEVVKNSYNQLRADPQVTFHLFKSRSNFRFICKRNRAKDTLL